MSEPSDRIVRVQVVLGPAVDEARRAAARRTGDVLHLIAGAARGGESIWSATARQAGQGEDSSKGTLGPRDVARQGSGPTHGRRRPHNLARSAAPGAAARPDITVLIEREDVLVGVLPIEVKLSDNASYLVGGYVEAIVYRWEYARWSMGWPKAVLVVAGRRRCEGWAHARA